MKFLKYTIALTIMTLITSTVFGRQVNQDSTDFSEQKQLLIFKFQNRIEELRADLLKYEIKIQQYNKDLGVQKEEIVDRNYVRLNAIKNELTAELKAVKETTEKEKDRLDEAKQKLEYLNDEIKTLIRKIDDKLNKNTRKS